MAIAYQDKKAANLSDPDPVTILINATPESALTSYDLYVSDLQEQLQLTRLIVQKILVPIVVMFGVTGNLLNIAVLTQRWVLPLVMHTHVVAYFSIRAVQWTFVRKYHGAFLKPAIKRSTPCSANATWAGHRSQMNVAIVCTISVSLSVSDQNPSTGGEIVNSGCFGQIKTEKFATIGDMWAEIITICQDKSQADVGFGGQNAINNCSRHEKEQFGAATCREEEEYNSLLCKPSGLIPSWIVLTTLPQEDKLWIVSCFCSSQCRTSLFVRFLKKKHETDCISLAQNKLAVLKRCLLPSNCSATPCQNLSGQKLWCLSLQIGYVAE